MEPFRKHQVRPASVAIPSAKTIAPAVEMEWVSLMTGGNTDVHLVECSAEAEPMSSNTTEAVAMQEVETMDVELQGKLPENWKGWMLRC